VRRRHKFISYRKENKERRRELLCRVKKEDEAHLKKQGTEAGCAYQRQLERG
jgi:hypothetical protein